jgi:hypothetical protein
MVGRNPPQLNMLCDACQKREATVHTTHIVGDTLTHSNLCESCFEGSKTPEASGLAAALQAGCRYCGGEPYTGSGHSIVESRGPLKLSFMCKPCAEEYFRFIRQELPHFGDPDITTDQIADLHTQNNAAVLTEAVEHMKQWVTRRNS